MGQLDMAVTPWSILSCWSFARTLPGPQKARTPVLRLCQTLSFRVCCARLQHALTCFQDLNTFHRGSKLLSPDWRTSFGLSNHVSFTLLWIPGLEETEPWIYTQVQLLRQICSCGFFDFSIPMCTNTMYLKR